MVKNRRIAGRKPEPKQEAVKVLCGTCSQWFQTPRQCLECSNWNVCLPCLAHESEATRKVLAARGIVI